MKGPKLDPPGRTTFDFKGVHFLTSFLNTFPLQGGPKLDSQQVESGASLEIRFGAHPSTFFRCARKTHQRHTNQYRVGTKGLEQGRSQLRLQKSSQFQVPKTKSRMEWEWESSAPRGRRNCGPYVRSWIAQYPWSHAWPAAHDQRGRCSKKQNHLQNSLLRRTQFWVRKTFSKPASLKRASLVALPVAISHKVSLKPKHCASATLIQKLQKMSLNTVPKMGPHAQLSKRTKENNFHGPIFGAIWRYQKWDRKIAKSTAKANPCNKQKLQLRLFKQPSSEFGTEEACTCEAWFQLTFRPQKWFPSSNVAIYNAAPRRQHSPIVRFPSSRSSHIM